MSRYHSHGRSRSRDNVSLVFAFFLSLTLCFAAVLVSLCASAFSKGGVLRAMDATFYDYMLEYVDAQATCYTMPTGIDPSVLDDAFVPEEVKAQTEALVAAAFEGEQLTPKPDAMRQRLVENVVLSFATDGAAVADNSPLQEIAESYADAVVEIYADAIALPGLGVVGGLNARVMRYGVLVIVMLALLAILLALLIMRLHQHVYRSLRYYAYATGGAGLMLVVGPLLVLWSGLYTGLNVEPQYVHHLCVTLITNGLWAVTASGVVLVALAAVLAVVSDRRRKAAMHRRRAH